MSVKKQTRIYLDNASATKVDPKVLDIMTKMQNDFFANPSSIHLDGVEALKLLEDARKKIALGIGALGDEIIFTSGGTESNNLAILGLINAVLKQGKKIQDLHLISTEIEHSSIKKVFDHLKNQGAKIDFIPVDSLGCLDLKILKTKINKNTLLISLSLVNSEIGTINDLKSIIKMIRLWRKDNATSLPYIHLDACQGFLLDLNVARLGIDLMTLDSQKIYGPKGVGLLYKRRGIILEPLFFGGPQENNLRAGTENVSGIVGFAKALEIVIQNREKEFSRLLNLKQYLWVEIKKNFPEAILNGDEIGSIPNILNFSIPKIDKELLVLRLDALGVSISTGSACDRGEGSRVINSITNDQDRIRGAVRVSFGRFNTKTDCQKLILALKKIKAIESEN